MWLTDIFNRLFPPPALGPTPEEQRIDLEREMAEIKSRVKKKLQDRNNNHREEE